MRQQQGALFAIHSAALRSVERYTAQAYAYDKLDIVLVPEFQFRGMEHPGAIFYRESDLLLNGSAAPDQQLRRAQLIAHEVAHMWFGNLVTIRWFDDVWLKEVLANFMADRIVSEQFAELDHDLLFYATHYPPAQAVDRSGGSHPIRQALANLSEAADLYGPIIYQKSPIALRDLETMLGPAAFREAVRDYVAMFRHANAGWAELAAIFESRGDLQLAAWADRWLDGPGRPRPRRRPPVASTTTPSGARASSGAPRQVPRRARLDAANSRMHRARHRSGLQVEQPQCALDQSAQRRSATLACRCRCHRRRTRLLGVPLGVDARRLHRGERRHADVPRSHTWRRLPEPGNVGSLPGEALVTGLVALRHDHVQQLVLHMDELAESAAAYMTPVAFVGECGHLRLGLPGAAGWFECGAQLAVHLHGHRDGVHSA
jgi:hypothetical protein